MSIPADRPRRDDVPLADKVRALSDPSAYPHGPGSVERVETHMSWVFLAGRLVFKLKKPVRTRVLDFSTLAAREADCWEEVRLNRRLAPDVYLGVVPLTQETDGRLVVEGPGAIIDWMVKMRRLPAERMLDVAIGRGAVARPAIEELGDILAAFYERAERPELDSDFLWRMLWREHQENCEVLTDESLGVSRRETEPVLAAFAAALGEARADLKQRVLSTAVVDAHGDLRPEHVCLIDPPVIIDCLEFNRDLRLSDPFDELIFLGLECERLGAGWIGPVLMERCSAALVPPPPAPLMALYRAARALVRARLALAHLQEPEPRTPDKWRPLAQTYLSIAEVTLAKSYRPGAPQSSLRHGGA
jgi:uncharacterized protein